MYPRHSIITKHSKSDTFLRLVRTVRFGRRNFTDLCNAQ